MYIISISKCESPVEFAALYIDILHLYLAGIDNLPVHLGYHSTNNDWRVSLQLFNSYNDVNEHEELDIWPDGKCRFPSVKTF